ncbi:hypothetical protein R3P38DRAFT_3624565 [Favolaschia claudopus]|uniref:Uncharacterized protein n=1 Tax=Favolaschia claudopus TaxID=2862362 RepID=A0AAW0A2N4_9AGAR
MVIQALQSSSSRPSSSHCRPRAVIGVYTPSVCVSPSRQAILANSMSGQRLFTPLSPPQLSALGIDFSSGPPYLAPTPSHLKSFSQASARVPPSPSSLRMAQRLFHRPQQQSMHLRRSHYSPLASRTPPRSTAHAVMRRMLYGATYPCRRRHLLIIVATGVGAAHPGCRTFVHPAHQRGSPRHSSTRTLSSTSVTARTIGRSVTNAMTLLQVLLQSLKYFFNLGAHCGMARSLRITAQPFSFESTLHQP